MKDLDIEYILSVMGNLSGIPIRIYENKQLRYYHSIVNLPKDPICLYIDKIFSLEGNLAYYITPEFDYYGIVNSNNLSLVIGPTRLLPASNQQFKQMAFLLELNKEETEEFVLAMKSIINIPLDSILQMMSVLNYIVNGEKKSLKEIEIKEYSQHKIKEEIEGKGGCDIFESTGEENIKVPHNTLSIEENLMNIVGMGNTYELKKWIDNAPAIRGGQLASSDIRHLKNTFIVTTTLVSRAAIRGGMAVEDAFSLSDAYIQRCELLSSQLEVVNLQYRMIFDYTEKVEKIKKEGVNSKLAIEVLNYVNGHLSEPINTQKMANELFISRSGLSTRFKKETGKKLTEYIMEVKIDEGKNLLRYTTKAIPSISEYLGFSSQSHFTRTFIKYEGVTPNEYRKRQSKE